MRRTFTLFACHLILWTLVTQLNHELTSSHVYLFIGSLFITFAALTQPFASGLWATILIGLVFDANTPVAFGTHMILFATTHVLLGRLRDRVARDDIVGHMITVVLANLGLFLVFSFTQFVRLPSAAALWPRVLMDLICSQLFLALIAPWYFALQRRALVLARIEQERFA